MDGQPLPGRVLVDSDRPSPARVYDWLLGGSHNFAADRAVAAEAVAILPQLPEILWANRHFLRRAVTAVAGLGVDQFIELGSGIPTVGNVHEVARDVQPEARVVYVDIGDDPLSHMLRADLLDARTVLDDPAVRALLDFNRPVCVLMVAVGHFIADTRALCAALAVYRNAVPPGSYLAMSHGTDEGRRAELAKIMALHQKHGSILVSRDRAELTRVIAGWVPIEPGLVYAPQWRPEDGGSVDDPAGYSTLAVVARKPQG
jgi:hypothetical protein